MSRNVQNSTASYVSSQSFDSIDQQKEDLQIPSIKVSRSILRSMA